MLLITDDNAGTDNGLDLLLPILPILGLGPGLGLGLKLLLLPLGSGLGEGVIGKSGNRVGGMYLLPLDPSPGLGYLIIPLLLLLPPTDGFNNGINSVYNLSKDGLPSFPINS